MNPRVQAFFISTAALGFLVLLLFLLLSTIPSAPKQASETSLEATASVGATLPRATSTPVVTPPAAASHTNRAGAAAMKTTAPEPNTEPSTKIPETQSPTSEIERIADPYGAPPSSFDIINVAARRALVNILCMPRRGSFSPISGSGVIIDPRGVILTNAHVAQYVLLSQNPQVDVTCTVRAGAPATPLWRVGVLHLPTAWVDAHVSEINQTNPMGTGEHDYAFLSILSNLDGSPLTSPLPYLLPDTRNGIGFLNDQVLAAAYPAEFVGGIMAQNSLYPASSVTAIRQLLTFGPGSVDAFSIGGVVQAQAGSSGGAVVNAWERLIGIISITSAGTTTADRDLRAITLSYINEDLKTQTGKTIAELLAGNPVSDAAAFATDVAPALIQKYLTQLSAH